MFPTSSLYINLTCLVVALMLVTWLSHFMIHRLIKSDRLEKFYIVSSVMFQVLGSIAGIMQAFVVVSFWNSYQDAVNSAHQEVENLTVTYRNITLLDDSPAKKALLIVYSEYVESIIRDEIPGHGQGHSANRITQKAIDNVWASLKKITPEINTHSQQAIFQAILADANSAAKLRQHRVNGINSADSNLLWVVLIASALLVMLMMGAMNIGQREGIYYLLSFSLAFIFALMITVSLDYASPYEGSITISDGAYGALSGYIKEVESGVIR